MDIESIIDDAEPAETVVTICIKGKLRSRYEALEAKLGSFTEASMSLAGDTSKAQTAAEMADLAEQMHQWERQFTLRAITPRRAWRNLAAKRPVKTPGMSD